MSRLRFRPDGTFTIVQFTDCHFTDLGPADRRTQALMNSVLEREKPDMVALTGDIIAGGPGRDPAAGYAMALAPVESRGLPWAAIMGNHDDEGSLDRPGLMAWMKTRTGCLAEPGPSTLRGTGHYFLDIAGAKSPRAARLAFLDSGSYARKEPTEYAWITREQISWFLAEAGARGGPPLLAFFHIPFPEYDQVWNEGGCLGQKHEAVCCPRYNSGFFRALADQGDVLGTFVGHDHVNDYEGSLEGIRLCYGRATGYGGYGREDMPRGGRVIRLREGERRFESWFSLASS